VRSRDPAVLLDEARSGDRAATGRLISMVERDGDARRRVEGLTFPGGGKLRRVVGITGAPGAGKSTLTDRLVTAARDEGHVGVIAVDPSSPFTGGAVLGDRIRMGEHTDDAGVYIRSMATRGHAGGLARAVPAAVRVLGAIGIPTVLVETVGVGQVEVEIAGAADTTVVVVNPGWGDSVQATKAGLLEIADVFVINKADRPGAAETRRDLEQMLDADPEPAAWRPPVLLATAASGEGTGELWKAIVDHGRHLVDSGELAGRRGDRLLAELRAALADRLVAEMPALAGAAYDRIVAAVTGYELDPHAAAGELLRAAGVGHPAGPTPG
jgi:LAO/AO transport system kinase